MRPSLLCDVVTCRYLDLQGEIPRRGLKVARRLSGSGLASVVSETRMSPHLP